MAIAQMTKIGILTLKKDADAILEILQKSGNFEPIRDAENGDNREISALEAKLADLKFVIDFLSPFSKNPKNFREKMLGEKVESDEKSAEKAAKKDFSEIIAATEDLEAEKNKIAAARAKNREMRATLKNWKNLHFLLADAKKSKFAKFFLGSIEKKDFLDFEAEISENPLFEFRKISTTEKHLFFLLIAHISVADAAAEILARFRFSPADREIFSENAAEKLEILKNENRELFATEKKLFEKSRNLAENLPEIKLAHDGILWKRDRAIAENGAEKTAATVIFRGFSPTAEISKIKTKIAEKTENAELFELEKSAADAPVLLKNAKMTRPFRAVLDLFGTPKNDELDPTPFLAPFFAIFFGFCLTDAGYGLLITLSTIFALKFLPLEREMREMTRLLLFGGIATILLGVLFGGYFGMTPEQLPFLVSESGKFYGQMWNPIDDLVPTVMGLAYGLGAAHLILGVILKIVNEWRKGNRAFAFWIGFPEIILIAAIGGMAVNFALFSKIALVAFLMMIWGLGAGMPLLARPIIGLVKFFMDVLVAWLSNILSYSRLFSLGLATGVIALAFNSIATTIGGMLPIFIGVPVAIFILLFGHTLNLGLNLLGAFVHSARLQFVEFFGKFFEGGGVPFSPLSRVKKYLFDPQTS